MGKPAGHEEGQAATPALFRMSGDPQSPRALNARGIRALDAGDYAQAALLFFRAAEGDPAAPALWINAAKACRLAGDEAGERRSLEQALKLDQLNLTALVRIAELYERVDEHAHAARMWSRALAVGRSMGERAPELDAILARGSAYVSGRADAFAVAIDSGLAAAREGVSRDARRRFDACIDHALGRRAIYANRCEGLHFPFLPADEFFDRALFPWLEALEAQTEIIRAEAEALLRGGDGFEPYVALEPGAPRGVWNRLDRSNDWSAFHLWRHGRRIEEACARCPGTTAIVERLPLAHLPRRTPTVFFSVLRPGTRIPPHTGVSNIRAVVHLPLIVPQGCGLRVGGESRAFREGRAWAFDDTIEHEAWNDSDSPRTILILDVWNPHLSEAERALIGAFYAAADASDHDPGLIPAA